MGVGGGGVVIVLWSIECRLPQRRQLCLYMQGNLSHEPLELKLSHLPILGFGEVNIDARIVFGVELGVIYIYIH